MDILIYILVGCIILKFGSSINYKKADYKIRKQAEIIYCQNEFDEDFRLFALKHIKKEKIRIIIEIISDLLFCTCICVVLLVMWFTLKKYI